MALDQSALLEVLDALKAAEVDDRIRQAAQTIYQALIELVGHGQVPGQVGHEDEGALEHADQQHVAPGVVLGDLRGQVADPALDLLLGEQHRLDARFTGRDHGPSRPTSEVVTATVTESLTFL
jgi:hypothetical protein